VASAKESPTIIRDERPKFEVIHYMWGAVKRLYDVYVDEPETLPRLLHLMECSMWVRIYTICYSI
jgi:hypothetical protein